jgi:serine/threonine-protein kinase RIO1
MLKKHPTSQCHKLYDLTEAGRDVPLPINFRLNKMIMKCLSTPAVISNSVELNSIKLI